MSDLSRKLRPLALLLVCLAPSAAAAAIITPSESDPRFGWSRGDAGTFYSGWAVFTDDDGVAENGFTFDSTPELAGSDGPGGQLATLRELSSPPVAFVTSTGNIYSNAVTSFAADIPSFALPGSSVTQLVAQFRTIGNQLEYGNILLEGLAPTYTETLFDVANPGMGGRQIEYLARWDLPTSASDLTLTFNSASSSMSLDQLHIDAQVSAVAVPEPASLAALSVLGLAAAGYRRLRRRPDPALSDMA